MWWCDDASSGGVAISEKNISVVAPMAIATITAKEKNLVLDSMKDTHPEIQPGNVYHRRFFFAEKNIWVANIW